MKGELIISNEDVKLNIETLIAKLTSWFVLELKKYPRFS